MAGKNDHAIVVGGEPRIDFLPPEIKQKKDARRVLRGLVLLVALVAALCLAAYAGIAAVALGSQIALSDEQDRTQMLLAEQQNYAEARRVAAMVDTVQDGRLVASATEVQWGPYLNAVQATLPEGATIVQLALDSMASNADIPDGSGVLAKPAVSTISMTAAFPSLTAVAQWQDNMVALEGFAVAWLSAAELQEDGVYEVQLALKVTGDAFDKRFYPPGSASAADAEATDSESETDGN